MLTHVLRHLHSVNISNGTVDLEHAGSNAHDEINQINLKWKRNLWSSAGTLTANLQLAGGTAPSALHAELKGSPNDIEITAGVKNILPADLQFILGHLAPSTMPSSLSLERLQMQTSLEANITLSPQFALQQVSGTITAGAGHVILPEF